MIVPLREFKLGMLGSLRIIIASIVRPKRKNDCAIRTRPRRAFGRARPYLYLLLIGLIAIICFWCFSQATQKESLVSSFIGLAASGGIIWGIRIVGGLVLGQQAMGFGDVTLMCMIGAFLGWQAALVGFVYSIAFAFVVALVLFIVTRKSYLAFGPYLCMGALTALLFWPTVWVSFQDTFKLGPLLLALFAGCLLLMAVLLPLVRWLKESLIGGESP
jgi:prepilin signal peptidase PulO-like enzyme (type II secretory pathway)